MGLNRRDFLRSSAGFCVTSLLAGRSFADEAAAVTAADPGPLKIAPVTVRVGAEKPFKALHVSDTHLCFVDERENERKRELAARRRPHFANGERCFDAALAYAKANDELFLHTGDLIDFVSERNLEAVAEKFRNAFCFVSSGNHEFSQYVGEAKEDAAYKAQSFERVARAFPNDLTFCARVFNGVNFIAFDDVYYNVTAEQLERFKAEAAKGLPMVALCHCPLYTPELFDYAMSRPKAKSAYLLGAPGSKMTAFDPVRREQQKPDDMTSDFLLWLREEPLLKAVFCGHLHYDWSGPFSASATQYVVGGNFAGAAYEIAFV